MRWGYQHAVEIEVYVEQGDAARDVAFDDLLQAIGAVLELDTSLGGLAFGLTYGRPEPAMRLSLGAGDQERDTLGDRRLRDQRSLSPELCFFLGEEISMARAYGRALICS